MNQNEAHRILKSEATVINICDQLGMDEAIDIIKGGVALPIGTKRTHGGVEVQKTANGWVPVKGSGGTTKKPTISLQEKLANKRAERALSELKFKVLPAQKETVISFLKKDYYNWSESKGTITCIGGKSYDKNYITIEKNGTYYSIGK